MRLARTAVVLASLAAIVAYLWVALSRIGYPYNLEWLEDTALIQVNRILHGQSLYVPPTVRFVPDGYPPLYFYLSAPLAWVLGVGYLPLRIVSFLASLATMGILYRFATRETGRRTAGLAAAGIFAAAYPVTGWWYDLARVDSLFVALCVGAVYLARFAATTKGAAWAGAVMALSFLTKQTALVVGVAIAIWYLVSPGRRSLGVAFCASFAGILAVTTVVLGVVSHGWYVYYVFLVLPHQQIVHSEWLDFWRVDVLAHLWPVLLVVALGAAVIVSAHMMRTRDRGGARRRGGTDDGRRTDRVGAGRTGLPGVDGVPIGFYAWVVGGLVVGAWLSRVHNGGFDNVLIPVFAAGALVGAVAAGRLDTARRLPLTGAASSVAASIIGVSAWAVLVVQVGVLAWGQPYSHEVPTAEDRSAGGALVRFLSKIPGQVDMPSHPAYLLMAGKAPFAHQGAVSDVVRSAGEVTADRDLERSITRAIDSKSFSVVIVDGQADFIALPSDFLRYYRPCATYLFEFVPIDVFRPLTDLYDRPNEMFVPIKSGTCPSVPDFVPPSRS